MSTTLAHGQVAQGATATRDASPRRSAYADRIRDTLATQGFVGRYDVRHIEAYMRLEHSTLDGLAAWQFTGEVLLAAQCIDAAGTTDPESLAGSFGL